MDDSRPYIMGTRIDIRIFTIPNIPDHLVLTYAFPIALRITSPSPLSTQNDSRTYLPHISECITLVRVCPPLCDGVPSLCDPFPRHSHGCTDLSSYDKHFPVWLSPSSMHHEQAVRCTSRHPGKPYAQPSWISPFRTFLASSRPKSKHTTSRGTSRLCRFPADTFDKTLLSHSAGETPLPARAAPQTFEFRPGLAPRGGHSDPSRIRHRRDFRGTRAGLCWRLPIPVCVCKRDFHSSR
jgi:hypothetical protein